MPAPKKNALDAIMKRYKITAREARDIATAVGTLGASVKKDVSNAKKYGTGAFFIPSAAKDVKKQVGEAAKAATTGKKGTSARLLKKTNVGDTLYQGKKRK